MSGLQEIQLVKTPEELENFMLKHGENIIDTLGAEVDRLEKELKVSDVIMIQNLSVCPSWLSFSKIDHHDSHQTCMMYGWLSE